MCYNRLQTFGITKINKGNIDKNCIFKDNELRITTKIDWNSSNNAIYKIEFETETQPTTYKNYQIINIRRYDIFLNNTIPNQLLTPNIYIINFYVASNAMPGKYPTDNTELNNLVISKDGLITFLFNEHQKRNLTEEESRTMNGIVPDSKDGSIIVSI